MISNISSLTGSNEIIKLSISSVNSYLVYEREKIIIRGEIFDNNRKVSRKSLNISLLTSAENN